jgi:hypothetical protein
VVAAIAATWQYATSPNTVSTTAAVPTHFVPLPLGADSLCALTDTAMVRERGLDPSAVTFARANGYYAWCIPEYDDDQRLHDGNANSEDYGSIAHVMATPELDALKLTSQFDGQYLQVAIIAVEPPVTSDLSPYQHLGLTTAHNCLYLQHYSKFFNAWQGWTALIVPPDNNLVCPASPEASATKTVLDVTAEPPYSGNYTDYPPTTRFIEGTGGRTLIGVRCAAAWCVVGPQGFGDIPAAAHANATGIPAKAQSVVKGWFDDQTLGLPDGTGKFGIHRKIRASAIPDAGLGSLKVADFMVPMGTETYKVVGQTFFPGPLPPDSKYVTVYGFSQGVNVVALRAEFHTASPSNPKADTVWFAQVTDANGHVKNDILTRRTDHRKVDPQGNLVLASIPATMRWRWFDSDEDLWVECDLGCCLVGVKN